MAVAETPGATHALARLGRDDLTIVPPGGVVEALAPLPLVALWLDAVAAAIDAIAATRASMAELMSRSCTSQKTVASHLARCGVLPLDGFGFDRAMALKVLADWVEIGSPKPCRERSRRGVDHALASGSA